MKDLQEIFDKALNLMLIYADKEDDALLDILLANQIKEDLAIDILLFLPTVFNRQVFKRHGIQFSNVYEIYNEYHKLERIEEFSNNEIFRALVPYSEKILKNGLTQSDLLKLISRCSEFNAIHKAIENKANLSSLKVSPMKLYF